MSQEDEKPQNQRGKASKKAGNRPKAKGAVKEARLAEALRANLRKRKLGADKSGDQE